MEASAASHSLLVSPQLFRIKGEEADRPTMHKVITRLSLRLICKSFINNVLIVTRAVLPTSWGQTSVNIIAQTTNNIHMAHTCVCVYILAPGSLFSHFLPQTQQL